MHCTYLSGGAAVVTEWKHATAYYSTYTYPAATTILSHHHPADPFSDTTKWIFIKINAGQTKTTVSIHTSQPASHLGQLPLRSSSGHKIIPHIKFPFCESSWSSQEWSTQEPRRRRLGTGAGDHLEDFILVIIIIKPRGSYTDSIYIVVNWDVIVGKAT